MDNLTKFSFDPLQKEFMASDFFCLFCFNPLIMFFSMAMVILSALVERFSVSRIQVLKKQKKNFQHNLSLNISPPPGQLPVGRPAGPVLEPVGYKLGKRGEILIEGFKGSHRQIKNHTLFVMQVDIKVDYTNCRITTSDSGVSCDCLH